MKLQSVELRVADVAKTAEFFEKVWGLTPVGNARLRGTAGLPYLIGLEQGKPSIRSITFCGTRAGFAPVWGPGRHGPGNNVFGYFVGPHGGVIEYTAEVEELDDDYKVGGPEDWKWPAGRTDQWGVSNRDNERIAAAERAYPWS